MLSNQCASLIARGIYSQATRFCPSLVWQSSEVSWENICGNSNERSTLDKGGGQWEWLSCKNIIVRASLKIDFLCILLIAILHWEQVGSYFVNKVLNAPLTIILILAIFCQTFFHSRLITSLFSKVRKNDFLVNCWLKFGNYSSGVFIARGKEDALVTKNIVPGESVYGEKRISVDVRTCPLFCFPVC